MKAVFFKLSVAILLIACPIEGQAQIIDLELQRKDLERCAIIDSVDYDHDGNVTIYYYDLDSLGKKIKRGHRGFSGNRQTDFAWISEDGIFSVAGMFFEDGKLHHVTIGMKGFYKQMISYHDNGNLYGMFYFDENDEDHGWQMWFDESGNLKEKALFEHGKEISSEIIPPKK